MLVVSIAGSPSVRSRSGVLLERARDWLSRRGVEVASHQVLDFPAEDLLRARLDSPPVLAWPSRSAAPTACWSPLRCTKPRFPAR